MSSAAGSQRLFGRENELKKLRELRSAVSEKKGGRLAVVAGRRRSGLTSLIEEGLSGPEPMPLITCSVTAQLAGSNLALFEREIERALGLPALSVKSFGEAFGRVFDVAEERPLALLIDDFQVFRTAAPSVSADLLKLWNERKGRSSVLLILGCAAFGSLKPVFDGAGIGLFKKADALIRLRPFQPSDLKKLLFKHRNEFSGADVLALYALSGGVPRYVNAFFEAGAFDASKMLEEAFRFGGLLSEAQLLVSEIFMGNAALMNEILMAVATGKTKRTDLTGMFDVNISGHLHQLEQTFGLLRKVEPLGENGAVRMRARYEITDGLLNFWYALCLPNRILLRSADGEKLREAAAADYAVWSERVLKRLYRRLFKSSGRFAEVGPWRDKKGGNEIDLVAIDPEHERIVFAGIKNSRGDISVPGLERKAKLFLSFNPKYAKFNCEFLALSLEELSSEGKLPFSER